MAEASQLCHWLEAYFGSGASPIQQAESLDAIVSLLKKEALTMEQLVVGLEKYLTSMDHVIRGRGILLLADSLARLESKSLGSAAIHSLVAFFSDRLEDWKALRGALVGCLALLRRKGNVGAVSKSDAKTLAESFLRNLQVQSLAKHDRELCFQLLECLLDHHPEAAAELGDDLVYGVCEAADGEKDPKCLLHVFHIVEVLGRIFSDSSSPLENYAGDIFDILGCYFPIHFTHPKSENIEVKRDALSRQLMLAMSSTPFFETHAVPLFLEKLSSSLLSAKVDSLKYLSDCVPKYGKGRMKQHAESIWSSVKETLYAAESEPTLSLTSELLDANQSQGNEVVREALLLLQKVVMQNDEKYSRLIISDAAINLIIDSIVNTCSDSNFSSVSMQKLHAVGCIMYASAKASSVCCSKLFGTYFLRLLNAIGFPDRNLSLCNTNGDVSLSQNLNVSALYLCIELLQACRDLMTDSTELKSKAAAAGETWPSNLKSYSVCLIKGLSATLLSSPDQGTQYAIIYLGVKGLGILATVPEDFSSVPKSFFEDILQAFMTIFTTKYDNASLWSQTTKELVLVGSYVSKHRDSERMLSFMSTVIDKMISLIFLDDGSIPLLVKLDTVCDIGTTYLKYMLRIFQGLEEVVSANFSNAKVNGNVEAAEIINQIMKRYTAKVLPCLGEAGEADDIIYHFAINIWGHVERGAFHSLSSDLEGKEMLSTTMLALKVAVSYCTVERQSKILEKAFNVLSSNVPSLSTASKSRTISPQMKDDNHTEELHNRQCMKERPLSALASVIIAVRPQTSIPNEREVAHLFVAALLEGHIPSAQALGSVFNKLHMKTNDDVLLVDLSVKELTSVLSGDPSNNGFTWSCSAKKDTGDEGLPHLSFDSEKASLVSSHAVRGLAWMAKGLLMRGHEKAYDIINILLSLLVQDETVNGLPMKHGLACSGRDQKIMETAADAFEVIMGDSDICLNTRFHAVVRPLYKQRLLSTIMPVLLSEIRKCDSPSSRYMLYRASGHVLSNAPLGAVLNDSRKLIPVLVECLSLLSNDNSNKENIYRLLLVLSAILTEESAAGQETVKENARIIIDCLIGLAAYPHKMAVRETAIQCLVALSRLPQTRIYPMKSQVLRVVSKAVDDPKRAVRLQAVRCREAWQSNSSQY